MVYMRLFSYGSFRFSYGSFRSGLQYYCRMVLASLKEGRCYVVSFLFVEFSVICSASMCVCVCAHMLMSVPVYV